MRPVNWRWLIPLAGAVLFFTVGDAHWLLGAAIGALTLGAVVYAMLGSDYARNDHFVHGHKEGEIVPKDYRVVASAPREPIDRPWPKRSALSMSGLDEPERLTRWVSGELGPAILQHEGLVLYREGQEEAQRAVAELHALLDPIFAEPIQTRVERWNEDLRAWQRPEQFAGDKESASGLGWEVRVALPDKRAARAAAERMRETGEVWVSLSGRNVAVAAADESTARSLALAHPELAGSGMRVRRLNAFTRRRFLLTLYDRQTGSIRGGWLTYDEPAAA